MLEKLAPTLLAGVPAIVKPASATAYLAEAAFRMMIEANVLPPGAIQLISGGVGDLFDHLTGQDVVSFTGSALTALKLRTHPTVIRESVRFVAEQDSLNASLLGQDAAPGTPEFDLFVHEVVERNDGQGRAEMHRDPPCHGACTISGRSRGGDPRQACREPSVGDPRDEEKRMGALVSVSQREDVRAKIGQLTRPARGSSPAIQNAERRRRRRFHAAGPAPHRRSVGQDAVHDCEPFGPVSTIMPYSDIADAIALANRGMGSLALSLFTHSPDAAREFIQGAASYHGRMLVIDRTNAAESTGHGSPLPVLVHGGPGRAGGSEEMGGVRGRQALHAAHRDPIVAGDDRRDHRAIYSRRAEAVIGTPPVPAENERAPHRRHMEDSEPHSHH